MAGLGATIADAWLLAAREIAQFFRRPARLVTTFIQPLLFLALLGFGVKAALRPDVGGFDYVAFIIPGLVGQRMLTTASRGGMGLIRDRHAGFLKEVLVAPVKRSSILVGLSVGHVFRSIFQGTLLLLIGWWFGIQYGGGANAALNFVLVLVIMLLMGTAIVMLSMAIAWKSDDPQNFSLATTYLVLPLFLLSGALYPPTRLPAWLAVPMKLNPLTYCVDAIRHLALGPEASYFPLLNSFGVMIGLFLVAMGVGLNVMRTKQAD